MRLRATSQRGGEGERGRGGDTERGLEIGFSPSPSLQFSPSNSNPLPHKRRPRRGFTLFELILAIALSATLLALIGTAINLYLMRIDASRTHVEEAQLARSILAMIADDLRATTIYQPQDTAAIAQLISSTTPFDVDLIDAPIDSSVGGTSGTGGATMITSMSSSLGSGASSQGGLSSEPEDTLPLGLSGSLVELYVDTAALPSREELFSTITGYTNAPLPDAQIGFGASALAAAGAPPSDLKTVRYFVREGHRVDPGGIATTGLAAGGVTAAGAGGLVRQEIPRAMRLFAEQMGNSALLDSGQKLVAPEVVHLEFRYFDGQQVAGSWDMRELKALPVAVEVRIWLASPDTASSEQLRYGTAARLDSAREYRQTVFLPMADAAASAAADMGDAASSAFDGATSLDGSSMESGFGGGFAP